MKRGLQTELEHQLEYLTRGDEPPIEGLSVKKGIRKENIFLQNHEKNQVFMYNNVVNTQNIKYALEATEPK